MNIFRSLGFNIIFLWLVLFRVIGGVLRQVLGFYFWFSVGVVLISLFYRLVFCLFLIEVFLFVFFFFVVSGLFGF